MTSPEALELEAVDAALAGRYVAAEHAELAELALLLRDERPEPATAWASRLDRRVASGFPARPRKPRFSFLYHQAAPVVAVLLLLAVPIGLAVALSGPGTGDDGSVSSSSGGSGSGSGGRASAGGQGASEAAAPAQSHAPAVADARKQRSVQRSAEITIATPRRDVDRVASTIGDVAAQLGGYVARSSVTTSDGGSLQLRVPSAKLDTAIQRLSKLGKVRQLSRYTEDITAQVVSARDRLNEARAERKGLLRQLATATTINETDSIKARLRIVAREIASARASLRRVTNRADFADVTATLVATRHSAGAGGTWTPGDAFHDALRVLEVIAGVAVIAAAVALPLLVAWLLGWLARRGVTRRRRERALDIA
jgi:hypothetical protein